MMSLRWIAAWALALACVLSLSAREMRHPLPPRRPPTVARTNLVRLMKSVRMWEKSGPASVDVLIAYDRPAAMWAAWKGGGEKNFAAGAVARMNEAVTNSNLQGTLVFRLVGVQEVSAIGGSDFDGVLDAVTYGCGDWAVVTQARERFGADIVMTLIDTGSAYGTTGLSWALYDTDYKAFADYAYGVCAIRAIAESHTMTHEVGHLFGAGHSDEQLLSPGPQLFSYSSGYYFATNGVPCRTIMAYDDDGYGNWYEEVPYLSSPDVYLADVAVGTEVNDNARTFRATATAVAAFRDPVRTDYVIRFEGVDEEMPPLSCQQGAVYALPHPTGLVSSSGRFTGWACSNGKRYDDGMLVFDLAQPGETVTMTAIWE